MKNYFLLTLSFSFLLNTAISFSQCSILNRDFSGYWIAGTLINGADTFDPEDWANTWITGQNALQYFESGLYPAPGSTSTYDAVTFDLIGPLTETGMRTLEPIPCDHFPNSVKGHFKHLGTGSDTLYFMIDVSDVDSFGDTTKEVLTATLISNTEISTSFQSFEIPMPQPHLSIFKQIDTLEITYRSVSPTSGPFILNDLDFGYPSTPTHENEWVRTIKLSPNVTTQVAHLTASESLIGMEVSLLDATGRNLFSTELNSSQGLDLNLEGMAAGIYFVECKAPKAQILVTRKLVKM